MTKRAAQPKSLPAAEPLPPRIRPVMPNEQARRFAVDSARLMQENHCEEIVVLDLIGVSPICDYFVIVTGTSDRQMRTVADDVSEAGGKMGFRRFGRAGYEQGKWILLDFVDVVVHVFDKEFRGFYDLELLWGDAKQIKF